MKEYLQFIKNPLKFKKLAYENENTMKIVFSFLIFSLCMAISYALLVLIIDSIFGGLREFISQSNTNESLGVLLKFLILSPILEELGFRLGLKINKRYVAISSGIQLSYFIFIGLPDIDILYKVLIIAASIFLAFLVINQKVINYLIKHYNIYVAYNIILFGLLHVFNYEFTNYKEFLYLPLLILPQLIMGSYFSFIRLKNGFKIVVFLHILFNMIVLIPNIYYLINN